jgi:hypothetical protein
MVSGIFGGTGETTYAENIGVMGVTRVFSIWLFVVAAISAILLGFIPKFGALVLSIPVRSSLTRYWHVRLRTGSKSAAVKALQTALHMPKRYRTGYFGNITKGYVNRFKSRYGWRPDGIAVNGQVAVPAGGQQKSPPSRSELALRGAAS